MYWAKTQNKKICFLGRSCVSSPELSHVDSLITMYTFVSQLSTVLWHFLPVLDSSWLYSWHLHKRKKLPFCIYHPLCGLASVASVLAVVEWLTLQTCSLDPDLGLYLLVFATRTFCLKVCLKNHEKNSNVLETNIKLWSQHPCALMTLGII